MRKNLNTLYLDACDILDSLNIKYGPIVNVTTSTRYTSRWGTCTCDRRTGEYRIILSDRLLNEEFSYEAAMDTMIHEVLHAHKDRFCHTGEWKRCAQLINREFPQYNIKRCTSSEEKGVANRVINYNYKVICLDCYREWKYQKAGRVVRSVKRHTAKCPCGSRNLIVKEI